MRALRGLLIAILILIVAAVIFAPPLIGRSLQKFIDNRLYIGILPSHLQIRVINYHRGWFSSDATLGVRIDDPDIRTMLIKFGVSPQDIPEELEMIFQEHIQHGPIFYSHFVHLPCIFGLAAIDRKVVIPFNQRNLFETIGINASTWQADHEYISFTGKFFEYFKLNNYFLTSSDANDYLQLDSIEGKIWQSPATGRMKGNLKVNNISVVGGSSSISIPKMILSFDLKKDANNLWIGTHEMTLSEIILRNTVNDYIALKDVQFNGVANETTGLLDNQKKLAMKKIQLDDTEVGPLHLQISANRINAQAISDLIDAYKDIMNHGELYESQLRQKMLLLLPHVVSPGASIQIDKLDFTTPSGQLQMNAKVSWPTHNFVAPEDVPDMIQTSHITASVRVSTALTNDIINLVSQFIYIYQIPDEDRPGLIDLRNNIRYLTAQNKSVITDLVDENAISDEDADELLMLIDNNVSFDDYSDTIKRLLFTRKITLGAAYLFNWQYGLLSNSSETFDKKLNSYEEAAKNQLHDILNHYLNQGYVSEEKKDYILNLDRENEVLKLNDHAVKD